MCQSCGSEMDPADAPDARVDEILQRINHEDPVLIAERGQLRERVRILRGALADNLQAWEGEEESVREEHADLIEETRAALEATKEGA